MSDADKLHHIESTVHGRYLVRAPKDGGPHPLLVGFHGYSSDAQRMLDELASLPGAESWLLVSVQALHPFYRSREKHTLDSVGASWMTGQDRELAIADNIRYVDAVVDAVRGAYPASETLVYAGFSQGAAMAWRAAGLGRHLALGVAALGSCMPSDLADEHLARVPLVFLGRGQEDTFYKEDHLSDDLRRLRAASPSAELATVCRYAGGHEWTPVLRAAVGTWLQTMHT